MKVCFVAWAHIGGGSTTSKDEYCLALAKQGYDVTMIGRGTGGCHLNSNGVRLCAIADVSKSEKLSHAAFLLRAAKLISAEQFDVVNMFNSPGITLLKIFATGCKAKWVFHIRTSAVTVNMFARAIKNFLIRIESAQCDKTTVIHRGVGELLHLPQVGPQKPTEMPIGINPSAFIKGPDERRELFGDIAIGKRILINVSTIDPSRNLAKVVDAMAIVIQKHKECLLVFVGDGAGKSAIEHRAIELGIRENIIFTGRVPYSTVTKYLSSVDVGLTYFPITRTYQYQPPLKTLEYMQTELPQVATKTAIIEKYISHMHNGILTSDSPESFAKGILKLLDDDKLYTSIKHNAKKRVAEYTWDSIILDRMIPLYDSLRA